MTYKDTEGNLDLPEEGSNNRCGVCGLTVYWIDGRWMPARERDDIVVHDHWVRA